MGINVTEELLDKIDAYLKGNLSPDENLYFKKEIDTNPELSELVKIQEGLFDINDYQGIKQTNKRRSSEAINHYKQQIDSDENQKLLSTIKQAGEKYNQQSAIPRRSYLKYYVAASIALFISTFFFLNSSSDLETIYKNNAHWSDLPSYADKGETSETILTKGEQFFRNQEFEKAIESLKKINSTDKMYPYALLYIGASYEQLNENEKALAIFDEVIKMNDFPESSRGYWYKLLIYAKENNKEKATQIKEIISQNPDNYNYDKVKELDI